MLQATAMNRSLTVTAVWLIAGISLVGCGRADMNPGFVSEERADHGLVVILPGIEGESAANRDIRQGLRDGGVPYALVICRWGSYLPGSGGLVVNQTDVEGNRRKAAELAQRIVQYQQKRPGRPIFIIGHSAGGAVAVFTLEALGRIPDAKPLDGVLLLSASISSDYDLTDALNMTRRGLANVWNPEDHLLNEGTAIFGNVDGKKGPSAGRTGFTRQYPNVYQRGITAEEVRRDIGEGGPAHFLATNDKLIARHAPIWILSDTWPPDLHPTAQRVKETQPR